MTAVTAGCGNYRGILPSCDYCDFPLNTASLHAQAVVWGSPGQNDKAEALKIIKRIYYFQFLPITLRLYGDGTSGTTYIKSLAYMRLRTQYYIYIYAALI